ncbi:MAG: hypothetical protein JKY34_12825 [Kordiimonadaceae bacterium]|nr:hypothetical protein [Kordiimonadaceae bacterium]
MNSLKHKMLSGFAAAAILSASATANTCDYPIDVLADAGTYSPVAMNDSFQVDACSSTVHDYRYYGWGQQWRPNFGLCTLSNASLSNFKLIWTAELVGGATTQLGTYSGANAINGLNATFNTGAGSFFSTAGSYVISLYLEVLEANNYTLFDLPGTQNDRGYAGSDYYTGSDRYTHSNGGIYNNDFAQTNLSLTVATVAEPAAALLLLPAFALIARRQRRKRQKA